MAADIESSGTNVESVHEDDVKSIGRFRTILPQVLIYIQFLFYFHLLFGDDKSMMSASR